MSTRKIALKPAASARKKIRSDALARFEDPSLYLNRELGLLAFQRRVLEEALDSSNRLLERVKFLSIVGSNLDEFFMVRVAALQQQVEAGIHEVGPDGMTPRAQLLGIRREVNNLLDSAHKCWRSELLPLLEEQGIRIVTYADLNEKRRALANKYFAETVFPVLTPLAFDPSRPFPHISNLSLNLAVSILDQSGAEHFARVKIPDTLPQLVPLERQPRKSGKKLKIRVTSFLWLDDLIQVNLTALFPGMTVVESHPFHLTRNADIAIQELEAGDLLETMEAGVRQRRFGDVVRVIVGKSMPSHILQILTSNLEVSRSEVYRVDGPVDLSRLHHLASLERPDLKDPPAVPALPAGLEVGRSDGDIFAAMRQQDILLHHPYDSFQPVIEWLQRAARDPNVLAIKMTMYRVGRNSPVVKALLKAMEFGKQVAVLVELKARFDEESNIEWARALEREGVHVVYGLVGLKIHAKVALVVRREGDTIRRYVHLATGNYNAITAHLYTDIGLFTVDDDIGADVSDLFNYLTGYSAKAFYRKLLVAPVGLRSALAKLIEREIEISKRQQGGGHLILKANALVDKQIIQLLYKASQAGVKIDLLIRGICCLRPGLPGVSDNIRVVSIVGRFLEHSRIFYFRNGSSEEVYLGSADLMPRNIDRRVEVLFPIQDRRLVRQLRETLDVYLSDNVKARVMQSDGRYVRAAPEKKGALISSQEELLKRAAERARE